MLLQEVAKRLKQAFAARRRSGAARRRRVRHRGGHVRIPRALEALANRLIASGRQPYEIDGHRIRSSVSIGIAIGPRGRQECRRSADGGRSRALCGQGQHARDASLLSALHERRTSTTGGRSRWICARRSSKGELELHYQPIIDLRRNAITGFEALARWRHPVKGMVPPAVFIPVAEDSGTYECRSANGR